MKRGQRNADGAKVRRLAFTLEQPVGRDMDRPLADLLDEATRFLGMMGPGEAGDAVKKRWLARWAIRIVCEALLRQGTLLPLPWAATVHHAGKRLPAGKADRALKGGA